MPSSKKSPRSRIKAILDEYTKNRKKYEQLCDAVSSILGTLLKESSIKKYQITSRAKDNDSLAKKLKTSEGKKYKTILDLSDLAGCRIAFYVESDLERFKKYIYENFDVIEERIHYSSKSKQDQKGYNATHLIIKLKENRTGLPEYKQFIGLKCEIQLTTVLYHAWSEVEHDITYKIPPEIQKNFRNELDTLKSRFVAIVEEHIKPAQRDLNYLVEAYEKLGTGNEVFSAEFFKGIQSPVSLNDLYQRIKLLEEYVGEFGDKSPKGKKITDVLEESVRKAKNLKRAPIKTELGNLEGFDHEDVVRAIIEVLDLIKYKDTEGVLRILRELSLNDNPYISKQVLGVITKLSKYTFSPETKKIYFYPQLAMLKEVENWSTQDLLKYSDIVTEILKGALSSSYEGHSQKGRQFTLHRGALPPNEQIKSIRNRSIEILKKMFLEAKTFPEKKKILDTLSSAGRSTEGGGENFDEIINEDVENIIDFYISVVPNTEKEILKEIEEQAFWFSKWLKGKPLKKVEQLFDLLSKDENYQKVKVLVGHEYRKLKELGWDEANQLREKEIKQFVEEVASKESAEWRSLIISIAKNYQYATDTSEYTSFRVFLFELAQKSPKFAIKLLEEHEQDFQYFMIDLVSGIWKRDKQKAIQIIRERLDNSTLLHQWSQLFPYVEELHEELFNEILNKAIETKDEAALNNLVRSLTSTYKGNKFIKKQFLKIISALKDMKSTWWVHFLRGDLKKFANFTEKEWALVLENLLQAKSIDYHAEELLNIAGEKHSKRVTDFFAKRLEIQRKKEKGIEYDAIPFKFTELNSALAKNAIPVIREVFKWFNKRDWYSQWEAAHFLEAAFPDFNPELEKKLIQLVHSKKDSAMKDVFAVLEAYEGQSFLHTVCKEIIKTYPRNEKYQKRLFMILTKTGVVSGEYGFVKEFESRKREIQNWTEDNESIRSFIRKYEKFIDQEIEQARKRADEDVDMMERRFGKGTE